MIWVRRRWRRWWWWWWSSHRRWNGLLWWTPLLLLVLLCIIIINTTITKIGTFHIYILGSIGFWVNTNSNYDDVVDTDTETVAAVVVDGKLISSESVVFSPLNRIHIGIAHTAIYHRYNWFNTANRTRKKKERSVNWECDKKWKLVDYMHGTCLFICIWERTIIINGNKQLQQQQ